MNIAITGHRNIEHSLNTDLIVRQACERINQLFPSEKISVFSCLAEGADRLLSHHLLDLDNTTLTVVLPLSESDYMNDFKTEKSKEEFYLLKKRATNIIEIPHNKQRPFAYQLANKYMLNNSQLVFSIWDGKPPKGVGGTAEMIYMARKQLLPIIWITRSQNYKLTGINTERIE